MLTGLYTAASGMIIQERVQDVLAQNLATSQMPGSRRQEAVVRSFPDVLLTETYRGVGAANNQSRYNHAIGRVGTGAGIDWIYTENSPGQMVYSGNQDDIALFGDGYFTVLTPDGFRYTRDGGFHVNQDGYLVNSQGHYVVGHGINQGRNPGPIQVNSNDYFVNEYGKIFVKQPVGPGQIMQDVFIDQLKIDDFKDKDKLFPESGNLFRVEERDMDNFKIPENLQVAQGYIERSNSIPTTEMVKLIDSYRIHSASARVLKALDQTLEKTVNRVAGR